VALNLRTHFFKTLPKMRFQIAFKTSQIYKRFHGAFFQLYAPAAVHVIKSAFSSSYCCYGDCYATEMKKMCSPIIGQFCDAITVVSSNKE